MNFLAYFASVLVALGALLAAALGGKKTTPTPPPTPPPTPAPVPIPVPVPPPHPAPPEPFVPTPAARILPVWVARSAEEWGTFSKVSPGNAAQRFQDEAWAPGPSVAFNCDAFPSTCAKLGVFHVEDVFFAARQEDQDEPLHDGYLREDFILHEVGGHIIQGVNGAHDAPQPQASNSLMNDDHGHRRKTEADRQLLRDAVLAAYDGFQVHVGPPA